jgi:methionine-gamma-lyase
MIGRAKMAGVSKTGFATQAIHAGYDPKAHDGALCPPLHLSSTFVFDTAEAGAEIFAGERSGYFYSRISNPTLDLLEKRMALLEGGEAAVATASGMGAIAGVLWSFLKPGDEVIVDKTLYGCTFAFMRHGLARFGVKITHVDLTNADNLSGHISSATKIVYFETPANPNMRLIDIAAVSAIARDHGARTVVDNTYATPVLTQPIILGADIVVHSATKYLGGHGDLVGGIAVGSARDMAEVRLVGIKDMTGATMAPFNAMLVMRGLKTLKLRMAEHCRSAMVIAAMLEAHPAVAAVYYPGLASFGQRDLALRQMGGFGGMIAFELDGGHAAGVALMNRLNLIHRAVSLGDAESLIQHPASMTHSTYSREERAEYGISDGLVRLSVGLEEVEDIIADLAQALEGAGAEAPGASSVAERVADQDRVFALGAG